MVAELPDRGDINGDGVVSYVMIEGDPENIDAQYCTEYSIKALRDAGGTDRVITGRLIPPEEYNTDA